MASYFSEVVPCVFSFGSFPFSFKESGQSAYNKYHQLSGIRQTPLNSSQFYRSEAQAGLNWILHSGSYKAGIRAAAGPHLCLVTMGENPRANSLRLLAEFNSLQWYILVSLTTVNEGSLTS